MGSPVFVGIQRILVAYDASPHSEHAVNVALSIAGDMKAKLLVLAVVHPPELAETIQASLIVMGKRSHTILHRWMLGSNTERVLKYAHCPVMIVH